MLAWFSNFEKLIDFLFKISMNFQRTSDNIEVMTIKKITDKLSFHVKPNSHNLVSSQNSRNDVSHIYK